MRLRDVREPPPARDTEARVVPEHERALGLGKPERFEQIGRANRVRIGKKECVEVGGAVGQHGRRFPRVGLGDLHTGNQDDPELVGNRFCQPVRAQQIDVDVLRVRLVLGVLGERDDVEAVAPRLLHVHRRPDIAVGEHGVQVEVPLQGVQAGQVRYRQSLAYRRRLRGEGGRGHHDGSSELEGTHSAAGV